MLKQEDLEKMNKEELDAEITKREELIYLMVGSLYPSILVDEINQLKEYRAEKEIKTMTLEQKCPYIKIIMQDKYPGWEASLLCPSKAFYYTSRLDKAGEKWKMVHFHDDNINSYYEEHFMLKELDEAVNNLPPLLADIKNWDSLIVNRRKPHTYRVFTQLPNGLRLCLHKFDTCDRHEAFLHPHPWPGAFMILKGAYEMEVGYSVDRLSEPSHVAKFVLNEGSKYEIQTPMTWHSVTPLETTYTIMVNGPAWDADYAHKDVRTTKGKDLDKMPEEELDKHLKIFQLLVEKWIDSRISAVRG